MTKKRDIEHDKTETRRLILDRNRAPYDGGVNWLGHGSRGGKDAVIDYLLLDGATMERLLLERGTEASIRSHFQFLKTVHDLPVTRGQDDNYRFDRSHLGISDSHADSLGTKSRGEARRVVGTVRGTGRKYNPSGLEALEIWVKRDQADGLPFILDKPVTVTVRIAGKLFKTNLRSTTKNSYVWLSPEIFAADGTATNLAQVLRSAGFEKKDKVELTVRGVEIEVRRSSGDEDSVAHIPPLAAELPAEDGALPPTPGEEGFEPQDDDRRKLVERQIRERRGQTQFRNDLRVRYGDRCLVSGCEILAILEAAHISPYRGEEDNNPANGLLLRADIHTLFDLDLLGVEPRTLTVRVHPGVSKEYGNFDGIQLRCQGDRRPSSDALQRRYNQFGQRLHESI